MARLTEELTVDFSDGMYDSVAPARYPRASARQIFNGRVQPDGSVRRRSGSIRTSTAAPNSDVGYGGVFFTAADGTEYIVSICGANAYSSVDYGETWVEIATGLRQDYYSFAIMRVGATNCLFMANADSTIKRWDGTTWDTLPSAPSGVKFIAEFNRRLYATGHSGVLVQGSKIGDPETWASPDGLTVQVDQEPTALFQIGPHLLVFDRQSTSYIDGYGEQTIIVAAGATGFSRSVGCVAFRTVVGVGDNGACWLSERGVEYYSPNSGIELVSKSVQQFLAEIDWEELYANPGRACAAYSGVDQDYYLALSTSGTRNNRMLVLNLLQPDVDYQRQGTYAAASVDKPLSPTTGDLLFGGDSDGYLDDVLVGAGGVQLRADARGYVALDTAGTSGDPTEEDTNGYLDTVTNDTLPASLFIAPSLTQSAVLYSVGYDGFTRRHYGEDNDDTLLDGTSGTAVSMSLRSRPFLFKRPSQQKRVRVIHIATIQDIASTVYVSMYGKGATTSEVTLTMATRGSDHADRQAVKTKMDADAPQVEVRTTADVRIVLVGVSAGLIRERL